jgi:hypothetical protein
MSRLKSQQQLTRGKRSFIASSTGTEVSRPTWATRSSRPAYRECFTERTEQIAADVQAGFRYRVREISVRIGADALLMVDDDPLDDVPLSAFPAAGGGDSRTEEFWQGLFALAQEDGWLLLRQAALSGLKRARRGSSSLACAGSRLDDRTDRPGASRGALHFLQKTTGGPPRTDWPGWKTASLSCTRAGR